jgi:DNA-binding NarL/FixJ family response regulator
MTRRLLDKIRVLLANHPVMLPDTIRRLVEDQDDMEVVGDCRGPMKILQETGRLSADAVILAQEQEEELGLCSQLLAVYPDLVILSVTPDLTTVATLRLSSHRQEFGDLHQDDIVQPLRAAIQMSGNH